MEAEQVLLTVPGTEGQATLLRGKPVMTLIITDKHIIAGKVGAAGVGSGIAESVAKGIHKKLMKHDKYDGMEVAEIVQADKHNFAFAYDELKEIEIKKLWGGSGFLKLVPREGKTVQLMVTEKEFVSQLKDVLGKQAPNIVKAK